MTRVLILFEGSDYGGDFGQSFAAGFRAHQCTVDLLPRDSCWKDQYDIALAYGPFRRETGMLPTARHLLELPPAKRPVFVWWLTEGIPPLWIPDRLVEAGGRARLWLDQWNTPANGHRLRIAGQLRRLQDYGVLGVLAVTSASRANRLRRRGFDPIVVPLGYHSQYYGEDMGLQRNIDVCFLGNMNAPRRRHLIEKIAADLRPHGIKISMFENIYNGERTVVLNRSKIMLNVMRAPQDFVGQRFLLGAANKALVVSEPINDGEPFVSGKHIVTVPLKRIAETVMQYLADDAGRRTIVDEAYRLVTRELTIEQMCGRILARIADMHSAHSGESL